MTNEEKSENVFLPLLIVVNSVCLFNNLLG